MYVSKTFRLSKLPYLSDLSIYMFLIILINKTKKEVGKYDWGLLTGLT